MSIHDVPTVRIQTEPTEHNPLGVVIINESDYNPEVHKLYVEGKAAPTPVAKKEEPKVEEVEVEDKSAIPAGLEAAPWNKK